ncbi:3-deoxy-D-manno-octulosonic acid transferase [Cryomorphaceae bacterium]|nr:3-deoxy-D-manno-octulosonic acid transferase [Cryomorphaceae bacterium]
MSLKIPHWYRWGVQAYGLGVRLTARWNTKARQWTSGRKNWRSHLREKCSALDNPYWIHCASLGEFEQGRPLIEALREKHPSRPIVLTFFSPSGFEVRKNYTGADVVSYLPLDTPANARDFVQIVSPRAAIFVKYENWLCFHSELDRQSVPRFLISARFRAGQIFFKSHGKIFREALKGFRHIFVQDQASLDLALSIELGNVTVTGDTRFDRVMAIKNGAQKDPKFESWNTDGPVLILGSSWDPEEALAAKHWDGPTIIAPHEVHEEHLKAIEGQFPEAQRYTQTENLTSRVILIDTIGLLSNLYQYADGAFIGGAFGKGLHNTLEAAVWGIPVFFGPRYEAFIEAKGLIEAGGAVSLSSGQDWSKIPEPSTWPEMGIKASSFVAQNTGAKSKILEKLD